jgi:hypothetical protein
MSEERELLVLRRLESDLEASICAVVSSAQLLSQLNATRFKRTFKIRPEFRE